MPFNINEFSGKVNQYHGFSQNNLFLVTISPPPLMQNTDMPSEDLMFFCRSVDIPGIGFSTQDIQPKGIGSIEKRPVGFTKDDLPAIFMIDSKFKVKRFFHEWMQLIYNFNQEDMGRAISDQLPFEFNWKNEYVGRMVVTVFTNNGADIYEYTFDNVYPMSLGTISMAWENSAEIMTLPVQFTYDTYKMTGIKQGTPFRQNRSNGILNYLSALSSFGNRINDIGNDIRSVRDIVDRLTNPFERFF